VSNVRTVTQSVNLTCPIYSGCNVVGTGTLAQAKASVQSGNGCAASAQRGAGPGVAFGSIAGALGLFFGRAIRARRRRSQSKDRASS
jgi:hypothetical protein